MGKGGGAAGPRQRGRRKVELSLQSCLRVIEASINWSLWFSVSKGGGMTLYRDTEIVAENLVPQKREKAERPRNKTPLILRKVPVS